MGRGKRCAAGVHTYLKRRATGYEQDGDLRGEARRRPARSDKVAAMQRERVHASCGGRSTCTSSDFMMKAGCDGAHHHGQQAAATPPLLE